MSTTRTTWLHTNRRALWLGVVVLLPLLAVVIACVLLSTGNWFRWVAAALGASLAYLLALCIYLIFQPRLSYADEHLLVRLRPGSPIRLPVDVVECFFLGQGPALRPRLFGDRGKVEETSTIVVRLAESAESWKHLDVKPALGLWCDGYITIRGTWCEPITNDLVKRLNDNLIAAHRNQRARTSRAPAATNNLTPPSREQEVG